MSLINTQYEHCNQSKDMNKLIKGHVSCYVVLSIRGDSKGKDHVKITVVVIFVFSMFWVIY
jgi:RNase P/RNase MRP subunit p30